MEEKRLINLVYTDLKQRGFDAAISKVYKNNISTEALTIRLSEDAAVPTIYPEMLAEMYRPGMSITDLSEEVLRFTEKNIKPAPVINSLLLRENLLSNVTLGLCKEDWNQDMLQDIVHRHIEGTDLAIYPILNIDEHGIVKLTPAMLAWDGLTEEEVMQAAKSNSKKDYTVRPMQEVIAEMTGMPPEAMPPLDIVILSNTAAFYGATSIADQESLDKACQMLGSRNVIIIPSSLHEVLVVPADMANSKDISNMIREVNDTTVQEHDRLSDHPYIYNGDKLSMLNVRSKEMNRQSGRSR